MLIGLTGRAQHGKDTAGSVLAKEYRFAKFAFADALRDAVWTLNPWVQYREPPANEIIDYRTALNQYGYEEAKKLPEVRRLLQVMGTEVARNIFGADCWVEALQRKLMTFDNDPMMTSGGFEWNQEHAVITDVRFPNEAAFVKRYGGVVIRVKRLNEDLSPFDNGLGTDHPSERYVDSLPVDYELEALSVEDLEKNIRIVAEYELRDRVPQA
jgi:hypothetical protein